MIALVDNNENERQRQLMARKRAAARDIHVPPCENPERRARLEADTAAWLRHYFGERLTNEFTPDQLEWIRDIEERMTFGGDKAIAAPRGEGKTTIAERVLLKAILTGKIRYAVLVAATGPHAKRSLKNIKRAVEKNELLCADYPEVCVPVREMDRAPQKAKKQTCNGVYTDMRWETEAITMPTVQGSRCSGSMISCHGLDSAIRGLNEEGLRPDFILIDDPETRESAKSDIQIESREEIIEKDLAGLGGPGAICGRLMLCTLQTPTCLAAKYTDSALKAWDGRRYRLLIELPKNKELWDEYVELRKRDIEGANAMYAARRSEMDEGAVVSNPSRFIEGQELSALQHCYNWIARIGWENFCTEFQNDPPEEAGPQESGIKAGIVSNRINSYERRFVPAGTGALTAFIDVGKYWCHWVVVAWKAGGIGFVVDYGVLEIPGMGTAVKNPQTVDRAILQGLRQWADEKRTKPYVCGEEAMAFGAVLIDSGEFTDAVYAFCKEAGAPFYPSKGFGEGRFHAGTTNYSKGHVAGNHWYTQVQPIGVKLVGLDTDHWKRFVHARFMTETLDKETLDFKPGSLSLFSPGNDKTAHHSYAHHICSEIWTEQFFPDKGKKVGFKKKSDNNHWLDATAGACAAADMCGIKIVGEQKKKLPARTLGELAQAARKIA